MKKNKDYPLYDIEAIYNLKELIDIKSASVPDKCAFAYWRQDASGHAKLIRRSYRDFADEVYTHAAYIKILGLRGAHIGIIGENSYEWLLVFFAVIISGNIAVLFDRDMTSAEISTLTERFDIDMLLCSVRCEPLAANIHNDRLGVDDICTFDRLTERAVNARTAPDIGSGTVRYDPDADDLCCIFFTSGTTGERKGVMLTHGNIASDIVGSCRLFRLDGDTYSVLPFHHAFGLIVGVLMVYHYGHTVYISSGVRHIRKELPIAGPQTMMLVPLFVENFHKQIWDTARRAGSESKLRRAMRLSDILLHIGIDLRRRLFAGVLSSFGGNLRYVICGGAAVDGKYIREFRAFGIEILSGYGTTECSPVVSVNRNNYHRDGSVGIPIPGSEVMLDDDGEVLIRGEHVMKGYYGDTEATIAAISGDGWYHSGDIGVIDDDGFIYLTGRKKNLIIRSNGENVSPEELEEKIQKIESVIEVLVYERTDRIYAEIYASEDEKTKDRIREDINDLNRDLPPYKRIDRIVFRKREFEKTTSMKIKRYS